MKPSSISHLVIALFVAAGGLGAGGQGPHAATAFVDVNVATMESDKILEHQTVIVQGDTIVTVGPRGDVKVPAGTQTVDGKGRYLMPGLAEMHSHLPSSDPNAAPYAPPYNAEDVLFLYVARGVTTVRSMIGKPGQLALREKARKNEIISPTLYLASPPISGVSAEGLVAVETPAEAEKLVRQAKADGYDLVKVLDGLSVPVYDKIADTAHEIGIEFSGHLSDKVGLQHALDKGQRTIEHLQGYMEFMGATDTPVTEQELQKAVDVTRKAAEVWNVPTLSPMTTVLKYASGVHEFNYDELKYAPRGVREEFKDRVKRFGGYIKGDPAMHLANYQKLLKALSDGGTNIMLGGDSPQLFSVPGFSIHHEMRLMADAGMSPYQVIRSGTVMPGKYFKKNVGTVAKGQRADLILVRENPLEDVAHVGEIDGVMVRGHWLPQSEIDAGLAKIEAKYRQ